MTAPSITDPEMGHVKQDAMPVIRNELADFDRRSGNLLERLVFATEPCSCSLPTLATLVLGYIWRRLAWSCALCFEKMIPRASPISNFLENRPVPARPRQPRCGWWWNTGATSSILLSERPPAGVTSCSDRRELDARLDESSWSLAGALDRGDRGGASQGGPVIPDAYRAKPADIEQLRQNIHRAASSAAWWRAKRFQVHHADRALLTRPRPQASPSTITSSPSASNSYAARSSSTAKPYQAGRRGRASTKIRVIGFRQAGGDLIDGLIQVIMFFGLAVVTSLAIIFLYAPALRSACWWWAAR